jgi:hypothetical protein
VDSDPTGRFRRRIFRGGYRDGHLDATCTDGKADTVERSMYHDLLSVASVQFPIAEKTKPELMRNLSSASKATGRSSSRVLTVSLPAVPASRK